MLIVATLFFVSFLSAFIAVVDWVNWSYGDGKVSAEDEAARCIIAAILGIGQFGLLLYLLYHYGALIERAWMAGR